MNKGVKHDNEKPMMALLSPFALEEIAKVMTFGAKKYSADNWREGFEYSRLISAVLRHITAYQRGETLDPETGLSHLAHASCGLMMLLEFERTGAGTNDLYWHKQHEPVEGFDQETGNETVTETPPLNNDVIYTKSYYVPPTNYRMVVPKGFEVVKLDEHTYGVKKCK
jgi:hypothetical protein